jgi:hypothetical protein
LGVANEGGTQRRLVLKFNYDHDDPCQTRTNRETKQNLDASIRVWDWHLAPDCIKRFSATPDDVDFLVWIPEHMEGTTHVDAIVQALAVCDDMWSFYFEENAQEFLGPDHKGDGFLVTCVHS